VTEPQWLSGDDFALGLVDYCPKCDELALRHGVCEECGYDEGDALADYFYDLSKETQDDNA